MKFTLNLSIILFYLFPLFILHDKALSLSNYQINKICKKEKRESACIKNLQDKRYNLQKGNPIEIQVIPYKR